jgi:GNAT superfamily N-acetyltransferase
MSTPTAPIQYRVATIADAPQMASSRLADTAAGPADPRIAAYLAGQHHPQKALPPRIGYVALAGSRVVGYIAGHLTRRFDCEGEVQYLYVAPEYRRDGIASALLLELAGWFIQQKAFRVCVDVNPDSPAARPFYLHHGATALRPGWMVWEDIRRR